MPTSRTDLRVRVRAVAWICLVAETRVSLGHAFQYIRIFSTNVLRVTVWSSRAKPILQVTVLVSKIGSRNRLFNRLFNRSFNRSFNRRLNVKRDSLEEFRTRNSYKTWRRIKMASRSSPIGPRGLTTQCLKCSGQVAKTVCAQHTYLLLVAKSTESSCHSLIAGSIFVWRQDIEKHHDEIKRSYNAGKYTRTTFCLRAKGAKVLLRNK